MSNINKPTNQKTIDELTFNELTERVFKNGCIPPLESEMDIYKIIDELGGITWRINHDAADERINLTGNDISFIALSGRLSYFLTQKLKEKYNVIPLDECPHRLREIGDRTSVPLAPNGCVYYWDWYEAMQNEYYRNEFESLICSACPLHEKNPIEKLRTHIPCDVYPGSLNQLTDPWDCGMTTTVWKSQIWTYEQLYKNIKVTGGEDAVKRFKMKLLQLKTKKKGV